MSVNSIGGMSPHTAPNGPKRPVEELTTVTTHCSKEHEHNRSCPHSVSTVPAPKAGEPGNLMDKTV